MTRAEPVIATTRARWTAFARLAAATALVIGVGGAFLFHAERPRTPLAQVTPESEAVERAAPPPERKQAAPPARVVAVVLPPPTRSVAPIPTLTMPAGVDRVRFELQLEMNDFPSYRVGLQDPATRRILWRSDWLVPRVSADQVSLPVLVPANLLAAQHYSLELTGRDAGGHAEVIGSYTVQVVRP